MGTASCVGGTPEFFSPVLLTLSKKVTMGVPGVPAMLTDKFCGCIDIDVGLRILSIVYAVFWVFYATVELLTDWSYVDMVHMLLPDGVLLVPSVTYWLSLAFKLATGVCFCP